MTNPILVCIGYVKQNFIGVHFHVFTFCVCRLKIFYFMTVVTTSCATLEVQQTNVKTPRPKVSPLWMMKSKSRFKMMHLFKLDLCNNISLATWCLITANVCWQLALIKCPVTFPSCENFAVHLFGIQRPL